MDMAGIGTVEMVGIEQSPYTAYFAGAWIYFEAVLAVSL
jgi:hypothetical protein